MSTRQKILPVIMCGGAGTRLWPVSRDSMPKQFITLIGNESTFQRVMKLVSDTTIFDTPIVITNADFRFTVRDQLQAINSVADIVLEHVRRDSAAAVAAATELALARRPDAIVGVFAADHIVQNGEVFRQTCAKAGAVAAKGRIVTIGIPPTAPATGYGYIRAGMPIDGTDAFVIDAFIEKPDATRAAQYVLDGYYWNSGNFIFSAETMRQELTLFAPDVIEPTADAVRRATRDLDFLLLDPEAFQSARAISIDYAAMERTQQAAVVPGAFGWSDVGGWQAVWDMMDKDANGNAIAGRGYVQNGSNNLIRADEGLVGIIGVDDIAVISTGDAVLVLHKDHADRVKTIVQAMRDGGEPEAGEHREIHRPWGKYISIDIGSRHQVKRITVKPGGVLSLQKHYHRAEHWVVVRGTAEVRVDDRVVVVHENESIYLPIGCVHRMSNPGKIPLEIIEVQVGSYLGEDDIIRIEDQYRRV